MFYFEVSVVRKNAITKKQKVIQIAEERTPLKEYGFISPGWLTDAL